MVMKKGGVILKDNNVEAYTDALDGYADRVLCMALDIGDTLMRCGAEVHRVEDTVERICRAYGAAHVEIFAIQTLIISAVRMPDGEYSSQIRRIGPAENDMFRLELFNDISRRICKETPSLSKVEDMIRNAKKRRPYPAWLIYAGAALATSSFTVFFGGTWRDAIVAFVIGIVMTLIDRVPFKHMNIFAKIAIQSFAAGLLACASVAIGIGDNVGEIMIGTIMISIPGLAFGVAIRDLFYGDFLAGTLKLVQSCLVTLMIAFGYLLSMYVFRGVI